MCIIHDNTIHKVQQTQNPSLDFLYTNYTIVLVEMWYVQCKKKFMKTLNTFNVMKEIISSDLLTAFELLIYMYIDKKKITKITDLVE